MMNSRYKIFVFRSINLGKLNADFKQRVNTEKEEARTLVLCARDSSQFATSFIKS